MAKADDLVIVIRTDDGKLKPGLDQAERKLGAFGNQIKKIGGMLAGVFAVERLAAFTVEITNLGGVAEGVRAAFNRIADDDVMERLKEATKGTVSELELMKRTVMASNFDIPVENLADLFAFATKRAQETGESVDYLVNSIVLGIGRKSPLILDNLGISAVRLRQELKGAGVELNTVQDIAAAVGRIAATEMQQAGDIIETSAIQVQQAQAAWEDLKVSWGGMIATSTALADALGGVKRQLQLLPEDTQRFVTIWRMLFGSSATREYMQGMDAINQGLTDFMNKQIEATKKTAAATDDSNEQDEAKIRTIGVLREELKTLKETLEGYGIGQDAEIQKTLAQIKATEDLIKSLTTLRTARGEPGELMQTRGETPQIGNAMAPNFTEEEMANELAKLDAYGEAWMDKYREMMKKLQDEVDLLNYNFNLALVDGIVGGLEATIAGANFGGIMRALLGPIASVLEEEGKILIVAGLGIEAFKKALSTLNGIAAIAVGGALIAAAQGMKALGNIGGGGSSMAMGGGYTAGSGGGGSGYTGPGNVYDSRRPAIDINLNGRLEADGDSLRYVLQQADYTYERTRG